MTDHRGEDQERILREEEGEQRRLEKKERRGEQLREAWRRHHPSVTEEDESSPENSLPA